VPSQSRRHLGTAVALAACGILPALGGCAEKQVHASAPVAPVPVEAVRPMTTAPDTDAAPPESATVSAPTLPVAATPAPPPVSIPAEKPPAPRKPSAEPASEGDASPSHPPVPQISPQLSPSDQASYERKTGEDVAVAENNLHRTEGRQLSAVQSDLTEKIRSFLAQSRDASKDGDWARAQNLAQKARVLSEELINSL
jgi:hypothetical protein